MVRYIFPVIAVLAVVTGPSSAIAGGPPPGGQASRVDRVGQTDHPKLDRHLNDRAGHHGWSRVIITAHPSADVSKDVVRLGGRLGRRLALIYGRVVELPNAMLQKLADHPGIVRIDHDRPTGGLMSRVSTLTGARTVHRTYGFDGAGVGVAVIDSGITSWHDDLTYDGLNSMVHTNGGQRVAAFVDFVNGSPAPYDDNGHGTHVSGIIAGNGYDSRGDHVGMAPAAHLVSLKVLDREGRGVISDVIAAFEYAVANRTRQNIRVVNLSVGAPVTSSYRVDPLTLAAKRVVDAGIVVVTAAGNLGQNKAGEAQWGGIVAPGNAPWVITVGASTHQGTLNRSDDAVAPFSSSGPTAIDYLAKPDIVASGVGTVSLSDPSSLFYETKSAYLVAGKVTTAYTPYLSLSGTSMAAPVVSGAVALMLQANPSLTPNLVKAILQYTAQVQPGVHALRQGAGFLNAKGAVELAHYFARGSPGDRYPRGKGWSRSIHWGNQRIWGGVLSPSGNAWGLNIVWGTARDDQGSNIVWGTSCGTDECSNIVWGTVQDDQAFNIVWGTLIDSSFNIVWGTLDTSFNIVWGTDCGGEDCFNIVWGTADETFNIVWGTADESFNIVWGTVDGSFNIVWGTSGEIDAAVWGSGQTQGANIVWGTSSELGPLYEDAVVDIVEWESLFDPPPAEIVESNVILVGAL